MTAETWEAGGWRYSVYDLSDCLGNETSEFEKNPHHVEYVAHDYTIRDSETLFGLSREVWRDGKAWAIERVTLTTHSGTHVDAPYHYGPESAGQPARAIDRVPLRWCFGPGVVLDVRSLDRVRGVTEDNVRRELDRIGYTLKPYDIVLVRTDASRHFKERGYDMRHVGLRRSATKWLVEQGVRMIGIDAWTLDRAFDVMVAEAREGDTEQLWESHYFGTEQEYCQIEKLANLAELPTPFGFQVAAFPVNLAGASAGWSRVVAIYQEPVTDPSASVPERSGINRNQEES